MLPRPVRAARAALAALLLAGAAACATAVASRSTGHDSRVITAEDIERLHAANAYQIIQRLHAEFLTSRGPSSVIGDPQTEPMVYVDNAYVGKLSALQNISANDIASIRLLRMAEAAQKYGTGHTGGVIEIVTRYQ